MSVEQPVPFPEGLVDSSLPFQLGRSLELRLVQLISKYSARSLPYVVARGHEH